MAYLSWAKGCLAQNAGARGAFQTHTRVAPSASTTRRPRIRPECRSHDGSRAVVRSLFLHVRGRLRGQACVTALDGLGYPPHWQLVIILSHTTTGHLDGGCPSTTGRQHFSAKLKQPRSLPVSLTAGSRLYLVPVLALAGAMGASRRLLTTPAAPPRFSATSRALGELEHSEIFFRHPNLTQSWQLLEK